MDSIEKSKLIIELTRLRAEDQRRFDALLDKLDAMTQAQIAATDEAVQSRDEASKLRSQISELMVLIREKEAENAKLQKRIKALEEQSRLNDNKTYGSKSQKSKRILNEVLY